MKTVDIAKYIDHTLLKPEATADDIAKLCREAKRFGFASVCVHPCWAALAAKKLKGSGVKTCTVVGFPLGCDLTIEQSLAIETMRAAGVREFDFAMNTGRFRSDAVRLFKEYEFLLQMFDKSIVTKLIIECCNLSDDEKIEACHMAYLAGFDFVKTSTGFGSGGATVEDVRLMRKAVGTSLGVKASGGIRTLADAEAMITAGATRIGTSAGVEIMKEYRKRKMENG